MTTPPVNRPAVTVTPIPPVHRHVVAPTAPVRQTHVPPAAPPVVTRTTAPPVAPPAAVRTAPPAIPPAAVRTAPPAAPRSAPPVVTAPIARPAHQHVQPPVHHPAVTTRPAYAAAAPSLYRPTPYSQPRGHHQQPRPYYSEPPRNNGFLPGFLGGTFIGAGIASLFGRRPQQSHGPSYGPAGAPYGQGIPTPDSMTPSQFTSFMNAAIEGRENDRTAIRSGQTIPTTPIERQYFKQVVFAMAQRDGRQIDPQGLFTPEVLSALERGQMDPRTLGSDIRHFSDSFSGIAVNSRNQSVQSPLANDLYNNYQYLQTQYASEFRQSQQFEAQQRPPQHVASYQQPPAHYSAPRSTIIPIFGMRT